MRDLTVDIEEMMINEAIRLSLMENDNQVSSEQPTGTHQPATTEDSLPRIGQLSSDEEDNVPLSNFASARASIAEPGSSQGQNSSARTSPSFPDTPMPEPPIHSE